MRLREYCLENYLKNVVKIKRFLVINNRVVTTYLLQNENNDPSQ